MNMAGRRPAGRGFTLPMGTAPGRASAAPWGQGCRRELLIGYGPGGVHLVSGHAPQQPHEWGFRGINAPELGSKAQSAGLRLLVST